MKISLKELKKIIREELAATVPAPKGEKLKSGTGLLRPPKVPSDITALLGRDPYSDDELDLEDEDERDEFARRDTVHAPSKH